MATTQPDAAALDAAAAAIREADALVIGASNGLSIAEGFNIFASDEWFRANFGDFQRRFGFRSVLDEDIEFSLADGDWHTRDHCARYSRTKAWSADAS